MKWFISIVYLLLVFTVSGKPFSVGQSQAEKNAEQVILLMPSGDQNFTELGILIDDPDSNETQTAVFDRIQSAFDFQNRDFQIEVVPELSLSFSAFQISLFRLDCLLQRFPDLLFYILNTFFASPRKRICSVSFYNLKFKTMKTHLENIGYPVRLGIENIQLETPEEDNNIKVVDFYENVEKQQFIITLYSRMFADSSVRIVLKEDKVFIVVSEVVDMAFSSVL